MGLQVMHCMAAGPATGAIYDTTHFVSPQVISTPIVMSKPGVITSCAITIFQKAAITLKVNTASWTGCPDKSTVILKSANIDQFTVTASFNTISNLDLEGGKSQYTGNGIVLDNSGGAQQQAEITGNLIKGHANDGILNIAGAYNRIKGNSIEDYGAHAIEVNSAQFVNIGENFIMGFGDETSSSIYAYGNCQITVINNTLIWNLAGFPAIDGSDCVNLKITSNNDIYSRNGIAIKTWGSGEISENTIGGYTALEVLGGGGTAQKNTMTGTGGDVVILNGANQYILSGNIINLIDAVGGSCGINVTGDTLGVQVINNMVNLTSTGTDDYGACLTPTETHMLNNLIDGLSVTGFSHGDYAFYFNNSAGKSSDILNTIRDISCVHLIACYKRVDPANNVNVYEDALIGDAPLDAGTGSSRDIFIQPKMYFADLPNPAGNGSHTYCVDCTPGPVVKGNGSGSMVFLVDGVWKGI